MDNVYGFMVKKINFVVSFCRVLRGYTFPIERDYYYTKSNNRLCLVKKTLKKPAPQK